MIRFIVPPPLNQRVCRQSDPGTRWKTAIAPQIKYASRIVFSAWANYVQIPEVDSRQGNAASGVMGAQPEGEADVTTRLEYPFPGHKAPGDTDQHLTEKQAVKTKYTIGMIAYWKDQKYQLAGFRDYHCKGGAVIRAPIWQTRCMICGDMFQTERRGLPLKYPTRCCPVHRMQRPTSKAIAHVPDRFTMRGADDDNDLMQMIHAITKRPDIALELIELLSNAARRKDPDERREICPWIFDLMYSAWEDRYPDEYED